MKRLLALLFIVLGLTTTILGQSDLVYLEHDGIARSYRLYIPASAPTENIALVIALHGGGGDGIGMLRLTKFNDVADDNGFIVVYPDGIDGSWNDGRIPDNRRLRERLDNDDVGFISLLIDTLISQYPINPEKVFVTGISNGGAMSHRLACDLSDKISAIAVVTGNIPTTLDCQPTEPVSILIINGTDDPLVLWDGTDNNRGDLRGTMESLTVWRDFLTCDETPIIENLPDVDPNDQTTIYIETYTNCGDDQQLVLYAIEGGGHTWASGAQYLPVAIIGRVSYDIVASEVIWNFFNSVSGG
ncbi:MAG: PHB depolymerase family esterase [bacterium]|nr:PHB depolymerase family esterase [bacterium]